MSITNTVLINSSSVNEFGLLVSEKSGVNRILHINKDFSKVSDEVQKLVEVRANTSSSVRHFFIKERSDDDVKRPDVSVVEISCNDPRNDQKWSAQTFQDAYIDFHQFINPHPGAAIRKVLLSPKLPAVTFPSFIKFVSEAYPNDYARWKMVDSDLKWVRETFLIPTLP